jgi:hypothetical protein
MKKLSRIGFAIGFALIATASGRAPTTLLSLTNSDAANGIVYNLDFLATDTTTTLSVAGYDEPSFINAHLNSVTASGGGTNLLGGTWTLVPAASGSNPSEEFDGTSVPGLVFGATGPDYDIFSQTFATTPGVEYVYTFTYINTFGGTPTALLVTTTGSAVGSVPEPSTWAMLLLGFAGLGFVGYRRSRRVQVRRVIPVRAAVNPSPAADGTIPGKQGG